MVTFHQKRVTFLREVDPRIIQIHSLTGEKWIIVGFQWILSLSDTVLYPGIQKQPPCSAIFQEVPEAVSEQKSRLILFKGLKRQKSNGKLHGFHLCSVRQ